MITKNYIIAFFLHCLLISTFSFAQTSKEPPGTKGLFIGISNYKHFTKLNYAHRDAEQLAHFFQARTKMNWSKMLLNESATYDSIMFYLNKLYDKAVYGDTIIFCFSGHGDVQNTYSEKGYFIAHDTAKDYYDIKGISIDLVNQVLNGLSLNKNNLVYLFADACRAAAINKIMGGPALSLTSLMKLGDKLLKFTSCQKDQVSMEYGDLDGGHGVFTFCLLKGLSCESDENKDHLISHEELRRYLFDNVRKLTNKIQTPMSNNVTDSDAKVINCNDLDRTAMARQQSSFRRPGTVEQKDTSSTNQDSLYKKIILFINRKKLVHPKDSCAVFYYEKLMKLNTPDKQTLVQELRPLLMLALEQGINEILWMYSNSTIPRFSDREIEVSTTLLASMDNITEHTHWMKKKIHSRLSFFKSFKAADSEAITLLERARTLDPDAAYIYFELGKKYLEVGDKMQGEKYLSRIKSIADGTMLDIASAPLINTNILAGGGPPIFFVKKGGSGNGSSWGNAFGDLQQALSVAKPGTEIWVATGIYTPSTSNNRSASFVLNEGISLIGGFSGNETARTMRNWMANPTVLSGNIGDTSSIEDNSYNIVYTQNVQNVQMDGFYIIGGNASNSYEIGIEGDRAFTGAGWYNEASSGTHRVRINNCIFQENKSNYAAGIYNLATNGAVNESEITNCLFIQNNAQLEGGAIMNTANGGTCEVKIAHCSIESNFALYGGAIFDRALNTGRNKSTIESNRLLNNKAYVDGADFFRKRDITSFNEPKYMNNYYGASNTSDDVKMTPSTMARMRGSSSRQ